MKNTSILLFVMILVPTMLFGAGEIAVVAKITGTVSMQIKGTSEWKPLKMGTVLKNEATVRTGNDGFASLVYLDDKSTVKMRPKSELKIAGAKVSGAIDKTVKMLYGESSFDVTKSGRQFRVETPTSVASVKGTKFFIIIRPQTQATTVYGISGIVEVSRFDGKGDSKDITTKTKAFVALDGPVIKDTVSDEEFRSIEQQLLSGDRGKSVEGREVMLSGSAGGTVTPDGVNIATDNIPFEIFAKPDSNYRFSRWEVTSGSIQIGSVTSAKTMVTVRGNNATIQARFVRVSEYEKDVEPTVGRKVLAQLQFEPNSSAILVKKDEFFVGKSSPIRCDPKTGTSFVRWEVIAGRVAIDNPESPYTQITVESADPAVLRARCAPILELDVNLKSSLGATKRVIIEYVDLNPK